jgi:hypothetical protein
METVRVESIPIALGREDDGRWWADIESLPAAIAAVRAFSSAGRRRLHRPRGGVPAPFAKVFSVDEPVVALRKGATTSDRALADRLELEHGG